MAQRTLRLHVAPYLVLLPLLSYGAPASAQAGPDTFTVTTTALTESVTCPNGSITPLSEDPSSTVDSGSNDSVAGSTTVTACGQIIYQASQIDDRSSASDIVSLDDATGETDAQNVSLLGGLVTFDSEQAPGTCQSNDAQGDFSCSGTGTFTHLAINGSRVATGTYAAGTTFNIINAQILAPNCTRVALFNGKLVLADSQIAGNDTNSPVVEGEWLHLTGNAICLGLPLGTTKYDLHDPVKWFVGSNQGQGFLEDRAAQFELLVK
ncbi:hypothetical protein [Dyella japonica]|uniref:Uncharacterized protein n=1 Tax=Dyella japonica DSM 16301 TaxID=1440762 RepID=A0A0G9H5S2_9GAMM|nr:hypothetical protein [Dyella japonica]KLD64594.1 hypothetical protein Y882_06955 [Dyella japonica DSM 16301]